MSFAPSLIVSDQLVADGSQEIAAWVNGLPFTTEGELCIAVNGTVNHYLNGVPFTSEGRVVVEDASPSYVHNGVPLTSGGRLAIGEGAGTVYLAGLPFVGGSLSVDAEYDGAEALLYGGDSVTYGGAAAAY